MIISVTTIGLNATIIMMYKLISYNDIQNKVIFILNKMVPTNSIVYKYLSNLSIADLQSINPAELASNPNFRSLITTEVTTERLIAIITRIHKGLCERRARKVKHTGNQTAEVYKLILMNLIRGVGYNVDQDVIKYIDPLTHDTFIRDTNPEHMNNVKNMIRNYKCRCIPLFEKIYVKIVSTLSTQCDFWNTKPKLTGTPFISDITNLDLTTEFAQSEVIELFKLIYTTI